LPPGGAACRPDFFSRFAAREGIYFEKMFSSRTHWSLEPNRFTQALEAHRRAGNSLLDLTASNPTECGFAYPEREIFAALADPRALLYRPESKGLREAREAVADYYRGRASFAVRNKARPVAVAEDVAVRNDVAAPNNVNPENIILTCGTSEAYSHIFRLLCEPGDEVLVPVPGYPLFEFLADLADVRLISYPLLYDYGWQIDLETLRAALTPRSRAILVVHPNNPVGVFVKPHEASELLQICAGRDMALVADEVFLDYPARDNGTVAAATFAFESSALTFTLSGISKISALPQMKLAWIAVNGPKALADPAIERLEIIADTYLSPGTPVQLALPRFLALRAAVQPQLQQRIAANLACLDALLLRNPGPLERLACEAGWYTVLRVPSSRPDEDVAVDLLERCSVLVHPGHFFNFPQEGFLVLSLIAPEAQFHEGVRRLSSFFAA
jgi:alanine-synthesizing transaminase